MVRANQWSPYAVPIISTAHLDIAAGNTVTLTALDAIRLVERKQAAYMSEAATRHPRRRDVVLLQDVYFPPSTWMRIHPAGARSFIAAGVATFA